MRILRVIARLNVGGPARHVVLLDRGLRARGHDTLLVHGTVGPDEASLEHLAAEADLPTLKIAELGRRPTPAGDLVAFARLLRTMVREQPDVVHTHTAKAGTLGRLAALVFNATRPRRRRAVVVHTFHGHVFEGYFSPAVSRTVRTVERLLARATDRVVTISPTQRAEIVERFGVGRLESTAIVPLGLDLAPIAAGRGGPSLRRELGIEEHAVVFGYVGRLAPIKNVPALVLAFDLMARKVPEATLLIVGDGATRAEVERVIAERGLGGRVRLTGWREDLPAVYATMDVCVLSSRNEGTPVALIEAMAAGRPVVATRVGGVADVVDDGATGLLVPPGDVDALAAAMERLAREPAARKAMGERARERALGRFGCERLVDDLERVYVDALAEKRGIASSGR